MEIIYLVQPNIQIGEVVTGLFNSDNLPRRVILVSAFAQFQTLLRYRYQVQRLVSEGVAVRIVFGVDLWGTSKEALEELLKWGVDARIFKNARVGHTFHPKIFFFEWPEKGVIYLGSSNITEGGFFKNYEGGVLITYYFPDDQSSFEQALENLRTFLDPEGETVRTLSRGLIEQLERRGDIRSEAEGGGRGGDRGRRATSDIPESPFGSDDMPPPPPIPEEVINDLTELRRRRRAGSRGRGTAPLETAPTPPNIEPTSFFMTLPNWGPNSPGEPRIPIDARDIAPNFWGWPGNYRETASPRGGRTAYLEWKPFWRIWDSESREDISEEEVRIYFFINNSDYRFYSRRLLNLGANGGDIVRITRVRENLVEFECALARRGTRTHEEWQRFCTQRVRNSERRFGYA